MIGFDAELYLRGKGEEMILGLGPERRTPWDSPLLGYAEALVAIGAIRPARARAIIDDYSLAETMRSGDEHALQFRMGRGGGSGSRRSPPVVLKPRRVVPCNRTIEHPSGTLLVRHVTLNEDTTSLAITWRPDLSGQALSRRRGHMAMFGHGPGGPLQPKLTDDHGTTVGTGFSGGGSDEKWDGHLEADQPLATDTTWIEIDGHRLELTGEAVACDVKIEPLPEEAAAHRYLWRCLAITDFHEPPEIESSIDALISAGAVDADDPVLSDIRAVHEAMPHHRGMYSGGSSRSRSVPEPWRSLLKRQGREDGPEGAIALSAVTPTFDGFSVALSYLESRPDGFGIEVDVAPGIDGHGHSRALGPMQLAWWAADDRGNHHLGQTGRWSGGDRYSSGDINFWPALRPKTRHLSIMPTAETSRAVIDIPLNWERPGAHGELEPA